MSLSYLVDAHAKNGRASEAVNGLSAPSSVMFALQLEIV